MKATGIVRRIDDLGRVVIPKEIRRTMRIREGDPLEIYTDDDGEVIFKKYSPLGELSIFAQQYAEVLHRSVGFPILVSDKDRIIAAAGISKKAVLERRISTILDGMLEKREEFFNSSENHLHPVEGIDQIATICLPIVASGDVVGAIMVVAEDQLAIPSETDMKLVVTAASFLGLQMEND